MALGFAGVALLGTLLLELRLGLLFVVVAVGVLAASCYGLLFWRSRGPHAPLNTFDAMDWMVLGVLVRVCSAGSRFASTIESSSGAVTRMTQYWDLQWHLAYVKAGLFRGLPLSQDPLLAGTPRASYHPAFDNLATLIIKGTGLPPDAGFYALVLPLLAVALVCALMFVTHYATGSRWAPYCVLAVLAGSYGLVSLLTWLGGRLGDSDLAHYADLTLLTYFLRNPPAALAAVAAMGSVALFVRGIGHAEGRSLLGAAVLAGSTVCMKMNAALALGPAFVTALAFFAWRRRNIRLLLAPTAVAVGVAALCYLPTRGVSAPVALDFGSYARWARGSETRPILAGIAGATGRLGLLGDALFLVAVMLSRVGWRLIPAVFALIKRPGLGDREAEDRAGAANVYLLAFLVWIAIVGFTLVEKDVGRFSAWNIAAHTMANAVWVGLTLASVGLYRIGRRLFPARRAVWAPAVALVIVLAFVPVGMYALEDARQVGSSRVDASLYRPPAGTT